jgi:uroporphyrinogen-III synthase
MQQTALLLPGLRVAEIAKDLAFKQIIVAENATHKGMIEALYDWRR